jgi:hypothetical protein
MNLYTQIARSHVGSSLLFLAFFLPLAGADGVAEAATVAGLAAAAWFASFPLMKRLIGAVPGA